MKKFNLFALILLCLSGAAQAAVVKLTGQEATDAFAKIADQQGSPLYSEYSYTIRTAEIECTQFPKHDPHTGADEGYYYQCAYTPATSANGKTWAASNF